MSNTPARSLLQADESAPLLPSGDNSGNNDAGKAPPSPDIFKWATVSEWSWLSTHILFHIRWSLTVYMFVVLIMDMTEEWTRKEDQNVDGEKRMKGFWFFLGNISWAMTTIYYWITSYWTYLEWKNVDSSALSDRYHRYQHVYPWAFFYAIDHVPQGRSYIGRLFWSFFYTLVVILPFVTSTIFWLVLVASEPPYVNAQQFFCTLNIHAINCLIAVVEIFFLNSLPGQDPIWLHIIMLIAFGGLYVGWIALGKLMTGFWVYRFVDASWHGHKHVVAAVLCGTGLGLVMFSLQYSIHILKKHVSQRWNHMPEHQN